MTKPKFNKDELWSIFLKNINKSNNVKSLTGIKSHTIIATDKNDRCYTIEYDETGNTRIVKFDDLYAIYGELYSNGMINTTYIGIHFKKILSWTNWTAPGSAILAILPLLDNNIRVDRGKLYIK